MELAEKVQRLRGKRSNADLAEACGCSPTHIQKIAREGSIPSLPIGVRLANTLGVSADWLADESADYPPPPTEKQVSAAMIEQVLAGGGLVGELSEEERALVSRFRALNDAGKGRMLGLAEGLNASKTGLSDLDSH